MTKPRIAETDEGIQGEFDVRMYDAMARRLRDRGWMETSEILKAGIDGGLALEVSSGPGYLGLEWLKMTQGTTLEGLDISPEMIRVAERNAGEYGLTDRVKYVEGNAMQMPFEDGRFDAVFSNGALHEWEQPERVLDEVHRVLKLGGRLCITDLRRDMNPLMKWMMWLATKPREIRAGLMSSINAAYTVREIEGLLQGKGTKLKGCTARAGVAGLVISGKKQE
jgi:ubiquinone/menaquinone biosynthesis C-methylase UbiE